MQDRATSLIELYASIVAPESFALSPDGSKVAFAVDINGHKQLMSIPVTQGGWPRRLTATLDDCTEPSWSPDGKRLVFSRGKALWTVNADGTGGRRLIEHPAGNSDPRWSPDGTRIAFYSRRRGWEHIWTIDPDGGNLKQVTMGAFDGDDLAWSPDGKSVAFCSARDDDLMTRGIYIIPATGGEELLISPRGSWSGAPHFAPNGRTLAYLADQDGWFHIYLYDLDTCSTRQVTMGESEDGGPYFYNVDSYGGPIFSPDGDCLAFVRHREGNFDVWTVNVRDGREQRVTQDDGHYRLVGWLPNQAGILATYDSVAQPTDLRLLSLDGSYKELTDSRAGEMRANPALCPDWVTYPARDGLSIHAALFRPQKAGQEAAPAVIFLHGGPNFQFANFFYPLPEILCQAGYVVLAPNFRGSTGYGRDFRQANFGAWGQADAQDVIDGARWLQSQPFIDPQRIAVVGPSYGGYLTLCVLTMEPELFCAGVDMYGDSEIAESYHHGDRYGRLDLRRHMGTPEDNPEGYRRGSPYYSADRIQAPVLLLHGKDDQLVVPLMTEKMIEALKIENKYYEAHFYDGEGHGFEKPENKKDAWQRVLKFLDQHCKGET